jgi:Pyruvate formate lyase-like
MHHNDVDFWRYLQTLASDDEDLPSPRVCRLLLKTFEGWKSRPGWVTENQIGHLFRGRSDITEVEKAELSKKPVIIRKALAIQKMLELVLSPDVARSSGSFSVSPDELIVGTLPPFSVGQGKEFVRYLTEDEELAGALDYLNELSPMGHIVPNHGVILTRGLEGLSREARKNSRSPDRTGRQKDFYEAVAVSLEAVIAFTSGYASAVRAIARQLPEDNANKQSLENVARCLDVAPRHPAESFHQALQAIYIMHCALHWTVEIVPIGRLDQLLIPFYKKDVLAGILTRETAQELIDCFWLKLDERVILNFRHAENRFTACDGVLNGFWGPSNYDQGALLNQWMQQITIGGQMPDGNETPVDACNEVTRMCLAAARRLPLNSPTLDLRVYKGTPGDVIELAARALLSGGAHPVLLNDDIIVPALAHNSLAPINLAAARNYACDGCYETMVAGESEFSFGFVSALDLIEKTLNRGAGIGGSGPVNLRGSKDSWRSKPARDIADFEEFRSILVKHMRLSCHRYLKNLTTFYGNKESVAPSPLLSAIIAGCLETGRDLTAGGAKYHIFSPLLVGIGNAADSLNVIKELVFNQRQFSLDELTTCLASDWGHRLLNIDGKTVVAFGRHVTMSRIESIRDLCLQGPKFGSGNADVDYLAWWLLDTADCIQMGYRHPLHAASLKRLEELYGSKDAPFVLHLARHPALAHSNNTHSADRSMGPRPMAGAPAARLRPISLHRRFRTISRQPSYRVVGSSTHENTVCGTVSGATRTR